MAVIAAPILPVSSKSFHWVQGFRGAETIFRAIEDPQPSQHASISSLANDRNNNRPAPCRDRLYVSIAHPDGCAEPGCSQLFFWHFAVAFAVLDEHVAKTRPVY
jgi:hypothetical protein